MFSGRPKSGYDMRHCDGKLLSQQQEIYLAFVRLIS